MDLHLLAYTMQWIPAPFYGFLHSEGFMDYTHVPALEDVYSYVILLQYDLPELEQVKIMFSSKYRRELAGVASGTILHG